MKNSKKTKFEKCLKIYFKVDANNLISKYKRSCMGKIVKILSFQHYLPKLLYIYMRKCRVTDVPIPQGGYIKRGYNICNALKHKLYDWVIGVRLKESVS